MIHSSITLFRSDNRIIAVQRDIESQLGFGEKCSTKLLNKCRREFTFGLSLELDVHWETKCEATFSDFEKLS